MIATGCKCEEGLRWSNPVRENGGEFAGECCHGRARASGFPLPCRRWFSVAPQVKQNAGRDEAMHDTLKAVAMARGRLLGIEGNVWTRRTY